MRIRSKCLTVRPPAGPKDQKQARRLVCALFEGGCRAGGELPYPAHRRRHDPAALTLWADAVSGGKAPPHVPAFEEFFRDSYRSLVRDVIFAGGDPHEAEDAVSAAMTEVFQRWDTIRHPRAYARRAAISNLIKNKQRGPQRIRERLIERGDVPLEHDMDPGLTVWEQREWVTLLLKSLPPAQREVLACMVDMFTRQEIAQLLGKTEAAVRQNLHAARKTLASRLAEIDGAEDTATTSGRRPDERQRPST